MKIVQFSDGNYAIRRWYLFSWEYLVLNESANWWVSKGSDEYRFCLSKDFEKVKKIFKLVKAFNESGKPVNMIVETI